MRLAVLLLGILAAILLPFFLWEEDFNLLAARLFSLRISPWLAGPLLAGLLAADIALPVPSSLVATASGSLLGFLPGAAANFAGLTGGCVLGYWLARSGAGGRLSEKDERQARALWERFGDAALIVSRAIPVLAEASILFAGALGVPARRFLIITSLANAGISVLYAAVGAFAMEWNSLLAAFAGSILVPAAALGLLRLRKL
jgi:uncharacterized membrane protein YdjX (TVP38/TMEM64 family)